MTTQTQVIWNWPLSEETQATIRAKIAEVADKETQPHQPVGGPGPDQQTVTHWWVDEPAALEWIAFVEPYNPVSASIVN